MAKRQRLYCGDKRHKGETYVTSLTLSWLISETCSKCGGEMTKSVTEWVMKLHHWLVKLWSFPIGRCSFKMKRCKQSWDLSSAGNTWRNRHFWRMRPHDGDTTSCININKAFHSKVRSAGLLCRFLWLNQIKSPQALHTVHGPAIHQVLTWYCSFCCEEKQCLLLTGDIKQKQDNGNYINSTLSFREYELNKLLMVCLHDALNVTLMHRYQH